jgi:hypothetical protein
LKPAADTRTAISYGGTGGLVRRFSSRRRHCRVHFLGLAVAVFLGISGSVRRGTTAMTDQLAAAYEGMEPFPGGGIPARTFEAGSGRP